MDTIDGHLAFVEPPRSTNFVIRFWRGGYSLGVSYWAFGAVGTNIVLFATAFLIEVVAYKVGANDRQALLATFPTSAALIVWSTVGIWSSANNHVARTGRKGWASAAKVMIVIGLISTVGQIRPLINGTSGGFVGAQPSLDRFQPSPISPKAELSDATTSLDAPFIAPGMDQVDSFPGQLDRAIQGLPAVDRRKVLDAIGYLAFSMGVFLKENEPDKYAKLSTKPGWLRYVVTYEFAQKYGHDMSLRKYIDLADQFEKSKPEILEQYKVSVADREHTSQKQTTSANSGP